MRFHFVFPEPMAIAERNPLGWRADIGHDKLHGPGPKQPDDGISCQRSPSRIGFEFVLSPKFAEGEPRYDFEFLVHEFHGRHLTIAWLNPHRNCPARLSFAFPGFVRDGF
jgi:hypothetical protein